MKKIFLLLLPFFILQLFAVGQNTKPVIYLWKSGAPGFEDKKNEPEEAKDYWAKNINNPSLTVYAVPKEKSTGAAVIICPGGAHKLLVVEGEGRDAAEYFNKLGITAFVLKYRLFKQDHSPYKMENTLEDGRRAMRVVRQQATAYNIDTNKIGLMGFSAGGELAAWVAFNLPKEELKKRDSIDNLNCLANFLILIFPGKASVPVTTENNLPPLFMAAANDDVCCSEPILQITTIYRKAKAKVEMHLYSQGDHAFNMGQYSKLKSINNWPQQLTDWLTDSGIVSKKL